MNNQTDNEIKRVIKTIDCSSTSHPGEVQKDGSFVFHLAKINYTPSPAIASEIKKINVDVPSEEEISKEDKDRFYRMTLQSDLL